MPNKPRVATRVLDLLETAIEQVEKYADPYGDVELDDPYANASTDPYANASIDPYAAAAADPYAALDPYAVALKDPYRMNPYTAKRYGLDGAKWWAMLEDERRRNVRTVHFIDLPPMRAEGELMWISAAEYNTTFEETPWDHRLHDAISFDEAAESANHGWITEEEEGDGYLVAMTIRQESESHMVDEMWQGERYSSGWPELMDQALALRKMLEIEPEWVVDNIDRSDATVLANLLGLGRVPEPIEIIAAIREDSSHGLGGLALDHAVWYCPGRFGPEGAEFDARLEQVCLNEGVRLDPIDNFLLHSESLHPDTKRTQHPHYPDAGLYTLTGGYVIRKITYTSDLTGTVIAGWRSLYLEPETEW